MNEEILQYLKENNLILKDCQSMLREIVNVVREYTSPEHIQKENFEDFIRNVDANLASSRIQKMFNL